MQPTTEIHMYAASHTNVKCCIRICIHNTKAMRTIFNLSVFVAVYEAVQWWIL